MVYDLVVLDPNEDDMKKCSTKLLDGVLALLGNLCFVLLLNYLFIVVSLRIWARSASVMTKKTTIFWNYIFFFRKKN